MMAIDALLQLGIGLSSGGDVSSHMYNIVSDLFIAHIFGK